METCWDCHEDLTELCQQLDEGTGLSTFTFVDCIVCHEPIEWYESNCPHCDIEYIRADWDEGEGQFDNYREVDLDLTNELVPYEVIMLCCDQVVENCTCAKPLDYRRINTLTVDPYVAGAPCHGCWAFQSAACQPLRSWIKAFDLEDTRSTSIDGCGDFATSSQHDQARLLVGLKALDTKERVEYI